MTQQNPGWWEVGRYQDPWGGVGRFRYPNDYRPGDPVPDPREVLNPQVPPNPFMPNIGQALNQFGAWLRAPFQLTPEQIAQRAGQNLGWSSPLNTPTPTLRPPFQSQAPFQDYPEWGMQTPPPSVGRGQPGPAWNPGYLQGRPQSWNPSQGIGPAGAPAGAGGGFNPNGGPWWTDPYGDQSFSGFDPNQILPWAGNTFNPNGPSPFAGTPAGAWAGIAQNMAALYPWQQSQVQQGQWQQQFGADQAQQGVANNQWNQTFGANEAQRAFANQLARDQFNTGANQWDRNFNANQAQQGWQNNFTQNEANRAADQWGQTFGANQAQQAWNNQFQTGRANAQDTQWGQQFGANESQRGIENARNQALDQWNQAFNQAGFDWKKQQDAEQNRLQEQGQNLAAFGRRFGPNVSYM